MVTSPDLGSLSGMINSNCVEGIVRRESCSRWDCFVREESNGEGKRSTTTTDGIWKITATTVWKSDLHLEKNRMLDITDGNSLGHELVGVIEEKRNVGERLLVTFPIVCGQSQFYWTEQFSLCDTINPSKLHEHLFGYSDLIGDVPFADVNCFSIRSDGKVLYLSDLIPTSYHQCQIGRVREGSTGAIWVLGPIGFLQARCYHLLDAKRNIGID